MPALRRLALLAGLLLPPALAAGSLSLAGAGLVASVAVIALAAALNAVWPLGGGMVVEGTSRVRAGRREWTFDARRTEGEARRAAFFLPFVTVGGFFIAVPPLALVYRAAAPLTQGLDEVLALAAVALLVVVTALRHRREHPLSAWAQEAEDGAALDRLPARVDALARLERPGGGIGHTGGIGAFTPGLHECLDSEVILRRAAAEGVPGAAELRIGLVRWIAGQAREDGSFPAYPGALGREGLTRRARAIPDLDA